MKHFDPLDERFTRLASDDSERSARIVELTKNRRNALWAILCLSLVGVCTVWSSHGALWTIGCAAVMFISGWCQFYQLHYELRALKTVEALKRHVLGNAT